MANGEEDWFEHYSEQHGQLALEEYQPNCVKVYLIPPKDSLVAAKMNPDKANEYRVLLLLINGQDRDLSIYPINTWRDHSEFLKPKYHQIKTITLADTDIIYPNFDGTVPTTPVEVIEILANLPSTFTKEYAFGLGLAKPYRFIIETVEKLSDCTEIVITDEHTTKIDSKSKKFFISKEDYEKARLALNRIDNNTQTARNSVKTAMTHNILAERIGFPLYTPKTGRSPLRKFLTAMAQDEDPLSKDEQNAVFDAFAKNKKEIAKEQPEKIAKLQSDIELVTLEMLIERYEKMLGKKLPEHRWQNFFNENLFILGLAFGYPVVKVKDQASVGGRKLSGKGDKVTDFLVKNSLTNNTAIFEIKKPQTTLLNNRPLRDGIFTPSGELSGSINQALDQKYKFQKEIAQIKDNSGIYDIESYAVHCCLIIGTIPEGNEQKKSFELFRRNSKDVEIITFDELQEKLKQLRDFLKSEETDSPVLDDELPF